MCSPERATSDTIAALGDAGATRKPEVGMIGGWQPVSGLPTTRGLALTLLQELFRMADPGWRFAPHDHRERAYDSLRAIPQGTTIYLR